MTEEETQREESAADANEIMKLLIDGMFTGQANQFLTWADGMKDKSRETRSEIAELESELSKNRSTVSELLDFVLEAVDRMSPRACAEVLIRVNRIEYDIMWRQEKELADLIEKAENCERSATEFESSAFTTLSTIEEISTILDDRKRQLSEAVREHVREHVDKTADEKTG